MLAQKASNESSVYFVPTFSGFGTPYWDMNASGAIYGLTQATTSNELTKAALEAICYQTRDVVECMCNDASIDLVSLRVDGGATSNNFLMQFQADILDVNVVLSQNQETTALGIMFMAGLETGYYQSLAEIKSIWKSKKVYSSKMTDGERFKLYSGWKNAVASTLNYKK